MLLSFITTIKICKNYEFLIDAINLYILNIQHFCEKYDISYEILICEQINEKNINDEYINTNGTIANNNKYNTKLGEVALYKLINRRRK